MAEAAAESTGLSVDRQGLVLGHHHLQGRALGEGDDVDLPALGHVHLRDLPDQLHDRPGDHRRGVAESQRSVLADTVRHHRAAPAHRHHDLRSHHVERHHGAGRELRLPAGKEESRHFHARHGLLRFRVRRACRAFEWYEAHLRGRAALGESTGAPPSSAPASS